MIRVTQYPISPLTPFAFEANLDVALLLDFRALSGTIQQEARVSMSETGASRVPRELLDYIKEQPLAAVAYANPVATHAHLKAPLAQSEAWTKLLGGHSLVDCLFEEQVQLLLAMLTGRRGQHEEMDLELRLPTTKNTLHLHLKLSRSIRLLVLTAIPPEPISYSTPTSAAQSPKHSSRAEGGPHPTRPSLTTTISTGAPPPILPRPQPPTFRLPRDSPVGTFELCSLAWDAPIGLLWADRNLNVLWCNKRWFQLAGE